MIRTPLCDLLGIDHPIIQAGMGRWTSARLAAAVSNAGGLGTVSSFLRPEEDLVLQLGLLGDLTDRPFAVNHVVPDLEERAELFDLGMAAQPKLVSLALAAPGDLVARAHSAGALVMHQVTTVQQAEEAAEQGVDIIVAQGSEAGGFGGDVSTMTLVPQVVDAVKPLPVVAAGGVFDGRGLAAALMMGAVGVNVGTRFLASFEAATPDGYRRAILDADSQDAVRFDAFNAIFPSPGTRGYGTVVRALRTPFIAEWEGRMEVALRDAELLRATFLESAGAGRAHDLVPAAGQSAGAIHEVLTVAEILQRMVSEAEAALSTAPRPT